MVHSNLGRVDELNQRRREAVRLRLQGVTLAATSQATGLSSPTIISAVKAYRAGGWAAVTVHPQLGRRSQETSVFNAPLEIELLQAMLNSPIEPLWSVVHVQQWMASRGVTVSRTGILQWCLRKGLYDPQHQPPAASHGVTEFTLYTSETKPAPAWSAHLGCAPVSRVALDARGTLRWKLFPSHDMAAHDHLDFMKSLQALHRGPVRFVMAGAEVMARLTPIQEWLSNPAQTVNLIADNRVQPAQATQPARPPSANTHNPLLLPHQTHESHTMTLTHLQRLEAESIHIMREVVAEAENPVMLYSIGKDSAVMLHLAMKAFYPSNPPFKLLHIDTRWKFREMYAFRDRMARELGIELLVHINPDGIEKNINPFTHGSAIHTDIMKTEGLKQALKLYGFDAAFGGARRDEEKSRAKERIFSFRTEQHRWDPKNQRPELWQLYNARKRPGESFRVFPLSNWTELDIWQYIYLQNIPIVPLYYAAERPVVKRGDTLIMVDDARMPLNKDEVPMLKKVRFRTLGCYPLTGAVESTATTLPEIIQEMLLTTTSERQGRVIDHDSAASMEKKKQEGYF
jgi:sulfate adenylyltransferase subunit 2